MTKKLSVVDVTMSVTCLEEDADTVRQDLRDWFTDNQISLCGGKVVVSKPKPILDYMRETLAPETLE